MPYEASAQHQRGELASLLSKYGYRVTRQTGSHLRLTTTLLRGAPHHHPNHDPLKTGTLNGIVGDVAGHLGAAKDKVMCALFQ